LDVAEQFVFEDIQIKGLFWLAGNTVLERHWKPYRIHFWHFVVVVVVVCLFVWL